MTFHQPGVELFNFDAEVIECYVLFLLCDDLGELRTQQLLLVVHLKRHRFQVMQERAKVVTELLDKFGAELDLLE